MQGGALAELDVSSPQADANHIVGRQFRVEKSLLSLHNLSNLYSEGALEVILALLFSATLTTKGGWSTTLRRVRAVTGGYLQTNMAG